METKLFTLDVAGASVIAKRALYPIDAEPLYIAFAEISSELHDLFRGRAFPCDFQTPSVGLGASDLALVNTIGRIGVLPFCRLPD